MIEGLAKRFLARLSKSKSAPGLAVGSVVARSPYLLVDVSIISVHDAGTGIQRVVRAISHELSAMVGCGYDIRFVGGTRRRPYRPVSYASREPLEGEALSQLQPGDIFLGLDFCSGVLPANRGQIQVWRCRGVRC